MKNIQIQSSTLQIIELGKKQEYFGISEVQTFSSSATKSNISFYLKDNVTNILDTNILCKHEKLSITDPATWTDCNMTQHIRTEVVQKKILNILLHKKIVKL